MNSAAVPESLAARLLTLEPRFTIVTGFNPREGAVLVWVGRMYGYTFDENLKHVGGQRGAPLLLLGFERNDEPGARRRAEWMRNPAADPTYPPPVAWHLNGGPGFHPPGWHPDARIVITPEIESSLRFNTEQIARKARESGLSMPGRVPPSFAVLPPSPPPPPPPGTIAYPDERGTP